MKQAKLYALAEKGKAKYFISMTSYKILEAVNNNKNVSYDQLRILTGSPLGSLYVFCERLEKAKLIKRALVKTTVKGVTRIRTVVKRVGKPAELSIPKVVK